MLQLIENLANSQSKEVGADPLSIDSLNDRKAKFMEVRSKIINEKIEKMTEGSKLSWENMKNELKNVNEVQSRSLGKKKLNNCECWSSKIIFEEISSLEVTFLSGSFVHFFSRTVIDSSDRIFATWSTSKTLISPWIWSPMTQEYFRLFYHSHIWPMVNIGENSKVIGDQIHDFSTLRFWRR